MDRRVPVQIGFLHCSEGQGLIQADPTSIPTPWRPGGAAPVQGEWRAWSWMVLALLAFYGLLWNPHWVPGGDSDFYLAIARNLALHGQFVWNGDPVGIIPPGWPLVLAGLMKICPAFGFLKVVSLLIMTGFWAVAYWVVRRFAEPRKSALTILLCGSISHVYCLTFWQHSDPLFALLCAAALVVAFQINEGRPLGWRLPMLLLLCGLSVSMRWLGVANGLLIAGALLHGRPLWPRLDRRWMTLVLAGVATAGTFLVLRHEFQGTLAGNKKQEVVVSEPISYEPGRAAAHKGKKAEENLITKRILAPGKWVSWLFWQPFRFASAYVPTDIAVAVIGYLVVLCGIPTVWRGIRRRQWIWLALAIYCGALCVAWPDPNPRYFVPLLPLIMLGLLDGIAALGDSATHAGRRFVFSTLWYSFVISILLCNVALWSVEVWVARSPNFYARYEQGLNQDLIAAGHYLEQHASPDQKIAVSQKYDNLNHHHLSGYGQRVTVLLANHPAIAAPVDVCIQRGESDLDDEDLVNWAAKNHVAFYLYQPPVNPWRLWHFRVPAWIQEQMSKRGSDEEPITVGAGWQLWQLDDGRMKRVALNPSEDWPTDVPGMDRIGMDRR